MESQTAVEKISIPALVMSLVFSALGGWIASIGSAWTAWIGYLLLVMAVPIALRHLFSLVCRRKLEYSPEGLRYVSPLGRGWSLAWSDIDAVGSHQSVHTGRETLHLGLREGLMPRERQIPGKWDRSGMDLREEIYRRLVAHGVNPKMISFND